MEAKDYLSFIVCEIHTTVVATVDDAGLPVTCAIDMMDSDENSLYFLTAKGKNFYGRLKKQGYLSLTGMKGKDTLSCTAVSVRGRVRELGDKKAAELFRKNQFLKSARCGLLKRKDPMTQTERRLFLINELLREQQGCLDMDIPTHTQEQKNLLRALFNIRMPQPVSEEFLKVQDEYLQAETAKKGITDAASLTPVQGDLYIWQGDITTLKCGAIVNAANSQMLGCFCPCHGCIDNAIHTFAGVQLRRACAELMRKQGGEEPTGRAKITSAYNLPCKYVLHTVGPIIRGRLTKKEEGLLASCYRSCLNLAEENGVDSIAFCCISTGEFHFPNERAAKIAVETVKEYKRRTQSKMKVIFNVFKKMDYEIYRNLLGCDKAAWEGSGNC